MLRRPMGLRSLVAFSSLAVARSSCCLARRRNASRSPLSSTGTCARSFSSRAQLGLGIELEPLDLETRACDMASTAPRSVPARGLPADATSGRARGVHHRGALRPGPARRRRSPSGGRSRAPSISRVDRPPGGRSVAPWPRRTPWRRCRSHRPTTPPWRWRRGAWSRPSGTPRRVSASSSAQPSAAPSRGSVPAPELVVEHQGALARARREAGPSPPWRPRRSTDRR